MWANGKITAEAKIDEPLCETRSYVIRQLEGIREDVRRHLNPTPYKACNGISW
jgi:hypothetical protein